MLWRGGTPPSSRKEVNHPGWARILRNIRNLGERRGAEELFHSISEIAFSQTGNGRVDRDYQGGVTSNTGAFYRAFGCLTSSDDIELIPSRPLGSGFDVLKLVPRDGRKNVPGTGATGCTRCCDFAARMHEPAVADRSEHRRKR